MRKIIAAEYVSLDGIMEEPSWTMPYWTDDLAQAQQALLFASDALLLGRITYEGFAAAWPKMGGDGGFGDRMNNLPKHVVTTTLDTPTWNATFIKGNVAEEIAKLKEQPGQHMLVYGSGALLDTLRQHDLVDEYRLMVHPLALGKGKRLFKDGSEMSKFKLLNTQQTSSGVLILTYGREAKA